ncbi:MAG: homoserine dehydrogenase [Parvibaculum sp.]
MSAPLRIGLAGLGTVGGGVGKQLERERERLSALSGREIVVTAACARDRKKDRGFDLTGVVWFDDPVAMAKEADIDVLVEMIGGSDGPAKAAIEAALGAGKSVVTANKALVALHGAALALIAEKTGAALNFEAAVAGGIPIIKAMREGLVANQIASVTGILNGTCNYILTEMEATGASFADVLADAQKLGYAEADPSFDIGGTDAAHKLAILASLAFGTRVDFGSVFVEGIERISADDIRFATEFGYRIKLLGTARLNDVGEVEQRVHPTLVPLASPLAAVSGVTNAVAVIGSYVGQVVLEGPGAGEGPTASAVVADLVDIARDIRYAPFGLPFSALKTAKPAPMSGYEGSYYLRVKAADKAGSMAEITRALAEAGVSIERIVQRPDRGRDGEWMPVVLMTHDTNEATMAKALELLSEHDDVVSTPVVIRIEQG